MVDAVKLTAAVIRALVVMSFAKVSHRTEVGMMIDLFFGTHFVFALGESCITEDLPFKNPLQRLFLQRLLQIHWFDSQVLVLLQLLLLSWVFLVVSWVEVSQ